MAVIQQRLHLGHQLGMKLPSPEQPLRFNWHNPNNVSLTVKRDDLIHPVVSGNKWRKLSHALEDALKLGANKIVSFGGGYSNHLHALGYCCQALGLDFTAIIRGDYSNNLTPMLTDLLAWGASLEFVNKQSYKQRSDADYLQQLQSRFPGAIIIPEGGSQQQAFSGVGELVEELNGDYQQIMLPVASGGTLAGLIATLAQVEQLQTALTGIAVLKGENYLEGLVEGLLSNSLQPAPDWSIDHRFHFGGYAKCPQPLLDFCQQFSQQQNFAIEPVYSGKVFYALKTMLENAEMPANSRVLVIHTGGLQGNR